MRSARSDLQEVLERDTSVRKSAANREREIAAEIERVRKNCELKYRVEVNNVVVKGHRRKFDDDEADDVIDAELNRHIGVDPEDETKLRKIKIDTIGISRHVGESKGYGGEDQSDYSQHDYEFVMGNSKPVSIQKINMHNIIKVQTLIRGFLARRSKKSKR